MAAPAVGLEASSGPDEVKPYKIHVSGKYLDLTKQKLELTRLPHEISEPKSKDWWEPKPQVEPLIDFWLEKYSWRDQERVLNDELPQYRTGIGIADSEAPVRLHFIHARSKHALAVPLLLIPPFPFTNLSLGHLVKPWTEPENAGANQPFHLVIPSLPGLGFSDALPNNTPVISTTAELLNILMTRIGYPHYLVSNAGAASSSPAEVDWQLASVLSANYPSSCLGAHFIAPPLASPKLQDAPWEWAKWSIANFFHAPILGYNSDDFAALQRSQAAKPRRKPLTPAHLGLDAAGLREPNTLAYALCDSPTGLLVFVLKGLRVLSPAKEFRPEEIINFTELAWLPGPEAALRFWAHCAQHGAETPGRGATRPRIALTVFLGQQASPAAAGDGGDTLPHPASNVYACPGWATAKYDVVYSRRISGRPGLLAWERPEVILAGVRGLARAVLAADRRLRPRVEPPTAPLERVVVPRPAEPQEQTETDVPKDTAEETPSKVDSGAEPAIEDAEAAKTETEADEGKGKGKEIDVAAPSTQPGESSAQGESTASQEPQDSPDDDKDFDGESPDTIVAISPMGNI